MSGSLFHNYKNYFSVVLLAIADSNYAFIYIDVGAFGKDSDSAIFEKSDFYRKIENNDLHLPKEKPLPGTEMPNIPLMFIGDEAFSLSKHVMRPFSGKLLSEKKRIFNYRLSRARRNVEKSTTRTSRPPIQYTQARNMLADYFLSDAGSVPWQNKCI
nr:unnamed protein product [Callosobruchus analis]